MKVNFSLGNLVKPRKWRKRFGDSTLAIIVEILNPVNQNITLNGDIKILWLNGNKAGKQEAEYSDLFSKI